MTLYRTCVPKFGSPPVTPKRCVFGPDRRFQHDLQEAVQHIQDGQKLKEAMKQLFQRHAVTNLTHSNLEEDVQLEYSRWVASLVKTG